MQFSSLEPDLLCRLVYVKDVQFTTQEEGVNQQAPPGELAACKNALVALALVKEQTSVLQLFECWCQDRQSYPHVLCVLSDLMSISVALSPL